MTKLWNVRTGTLLARIAERSPQNIALPLTIPNNTIVKLISGKLPNGLKIDGTHIVGSAFEVSRTYNFEFVLRAVSGVNISDRTFKIIVDGKDDPVWITPEGTLPVNPNSLYFILDNTPVDFQLSAIDPDLPAGDRITYTIAKNDGELPPGIRLSADGRLTGIVDPILALDLEGGDGGYDTSPFGKYPLDFGVPTSTVGMDSFYYDFTVYDYGISAKIPRKLNRNYEFIVTASDNVSFTKRKFKIYVVGDDYLKADNNVMRAADGLFTSDGTFVRKPIWLTPRDLGVRRANNHVTLYLDALNSNTLAGVMFYKLKRRNPDGSPSKLPPGLTLDNTTGELAGYIPYQPAVTQNYKFTVSATRYNSTTGLVSVVGTFYEDVLVGKNFIKVYKLPTTTNDGIEDLYSLVGRDISIENNTYTVDHVDDSNIDYDMIYFKSTVTALPDIDPLVVNRTATSQNYFFINPISQNSKDFYKNRGINISDVSQYSINEVYPYIEWKIIPAYGASEVILDTTNTNSSPGDNMKTVLESLLTRDSRPAYATVTTNLAGKVTQVVMQLPATSGNRNSNYIRSLFRSNNSTSVRQTNLGDIDRVSLASNISGSFLTDRTFSLAVLKGNSFDETFNVAEMEDFSTNKTFTLSVLGEVESTITWDTPEDLGTLVAGRPSTITLKANTALVDSVVQYNKIGGRLPPGMSLQSDGSLVGSPRQFNIGSLPGLIEFDGGSTTFDNETTSLDRTYEFTVLARDRFGFSAVTRTFSIAISDTDKNRYSNIYMKPLLTVEQRNYFEQFINNSRIFIPEYLYRAGDVSFGLQRDLRALVYAGIQTKNINYYVSAAAKNHKRKQYYLGEVTSAVAKNPGTDEVVYEVVYVKLVDPAMPDAGNTKTRIRIKTQNEITVDSQQYDFDTENDPYKNTLDDPLMTIDNDGVNIDQPTYSFGYISNIKNMRNRIKTIGASSGDFLPLWMRTQQDVLSQQTTFVPAIPICYTLPGYSKLIVENINNAVNSGAFDFKLINYEIDRYIVDRVLGKSGEQQIVFANYKYNI